MSVPTELVEAARAVDILETAQRFIRLKRIAANEWAGPCPGCGGDDRFRLNPRKAVFHCRGSGAKGDTIALVRLARGVGFAEGVCACERVLFREVQILFR